MAIPGGRPQSHEEDVFAFVADKHGGASRPAAAPLIGESWRRCVTNYKLDPARDGQPRILTAGELKQQREPIDAFARLARERIEGLYAQVAGAGLVVLLTNTNGVTIEYRGDPSIEDDLKAAGLYLGSVWAEEVEGTNGVGTCLATGRPLTVFRDEHFRTRNIGLTCTVAPIRDPFGEVMAVLDVSSMTATTRESQHLALQLVQAAARQLERAHLNQLFGQHWKLHLHRPQAAGGASEMMLVVSEDGRVLAADSAAFEAGLAAGRRSLVDAPLDAVFADLPDLETILRAAHDGRDCTGRLRALDSDVGLRLGAPEQRRRPPRGPASRPRPSARPCEPLALDDLAGGDSRLAAQVGRLRRILDRDIPVLLQGETGTGKELFARAIHRAGPRADGPFVALNCAAIPDSLIESELFGYRAGAFTGARRQGMPGRVVEADGGTLFLDEIGDMPLALQSRLLRVLSEREVLPLGDGPPRRVDFRLVCATNQDLPARVREGLFRADLYYRVRGFTVELPPLRRRADKAELIGEVLAQEAATAGRPARLAPKALATLAAHDWPGNIRELRDVLRIALAVTEGPVVRADDLPHLADTPAPADAKPDRREAPGREDPRAAAEAALEREAWCVARAARRLGVSRATLHRRMRRYGLVAPNKRAAATPASGG